MTKLDTKKVTAMLGTDTRVLMSGFGDNAMKMEDMNSNSCTSDEQRMSMGRPKKGILVINLYMNSNKKMTTFINIVAAVRVNTLPMDSAGWRMKYDANGSKYDASTLATLTASFKIRTQMLKATGESFTK